MQVTGRLGSLEGARPGVAWRGVAWRGLQATATALQGPEDGLAQFHRSAVAKSPMFSFLGGSFVGSDCQEGGRKPSNPFSFMRPFLGSCLARWLICL